MHSPRTARLWDNFPVTHQLMFSSISKANLCIFIIQLQMGLLSVRLSNLLKSPAQFFTSLIAPVTPSKLKLAFQPTFYSSLPCLLSLLAFLCSFFLTFPAIYPAGRPLGVYYSASQCAVLGLGYVKAVLTFPEVTEVRQQNFCVVEGGGPEEVVLVHFAELLAVHILEDGGVNLH